MRFSEDFMTELLSRVDIEEIISKYTDIKNAGSRTPVALCPFHSEKTPSFYIYRETNSFYCFGCGIGGNALTFIKNIEHLDTTEAVKLLCEKTGMTMPEDNKQDEARLSLRRRCYEANREAARFFHRCLSLPEAKPAVDYIKKRQLTKETVTHFGLGYAPDRWDALLKHLKQKGFNENELVVFYLARKTKNGGTVDAFRNRLMFPIMDLRGNVIAFGGRVLDDSKPKYINTSDTPVYKKGNGIYALNFAKNNNDRKLILCEGYMDVIAMHQAGFTNAVAGLGTAFTPEQVSLLGRYCDELYLSFDSDEAGRKATERALSMLQKSTLKIKVLDYSGVGKDPDEVIKTQGSDRMKKVINAAVNDTEFAINRAKSKYDITTDDGRLGYINEAVDILAKIPNAVERDIYTSKIADEVSVSPDALKAQMKKAIRREEKRAEILKFEEALEHMRGSDSKVPNPERKNYPKAANAEEFILAAILKNPDLVTKKNAELKESLFITQYNRNFFNALSSRIASGRSIDINSFDGENDNDNGNEEVSYMAYLAAMGHIVDKNPKGVEQCIQTLLAEKERLSVPQTARGMSDEEWVRAMQDKQKKNQNQ